MTYKKPNNNNRYGVLISVLFALCIYLLCTGFILMPYNGIYVSLDKTDCYTEESGKVTCDCRDLSSREVLSGVSFDVIKDTDNTSLSFSSLQSGMFMKMSVNPNIETESGIVDSTTSDSEISTGKIQKGYTVSITVRCEGQTVNELKGEFLYDPNILKPRLYYDNSKSAYLEFTALELLFGSQSSGYLHFSGQPFALFFWVPPVAGAIGALILRRKTAGNVLGMICSIAGILAIAYLIGGARLTFSSTISIVVYMVIFALCVLSTLKKSAQTESSKKSAKEQAGN